MKGLLKENGGEFELFNSRDYEFQNSLYVFQFKSLGKTSYHWRGEDNTLSLSYCVGVWKIKSKN